MASIGFGLNKNFISMNSLPWVQIVRQRRMRLWRKSYQRRSFLSAMLPRFELFTSHDPQWDLRPPLSGGIFGRKPPSVNRQEILKIIKHRIIRNKS
jgi:hypothetical protein